MPRFIYKGERARPGLVKVRGECTEIRVPCKDGSKLIIRPHAGQANFAVGHDCGVDVDDERALRVMRADPRFQEIPAH